jgi:hypothetical protein
MKNIKYSKDVDALLIELSDKPIGYAEDDGQVILHYSDDNRLFWFLCGNEVYTDSFFFQNSPKSLVQ